MPGRVGRDLRVDARRDQPEICSGDEPFARVAPGIAERLDLLEVRELADIHLRGEMAPDRVLQRFVGAEPPARERPRAEEGLARPQPEQRLKLLFPHLEHDPERLVGRAMLCGRLFHRLST
jgi:hypothetical protein